MRFVGSAFLAETLRKKTAETQRSNACGEAAFSIPAKLKMIRCACGAKQPLCVSAGLLLCVSARTAMRTQPIPRRRTRDYARKQRATAGAGLLEPYERGSATILRTTDGNLAKRPFGPVASGGDGAGSRPCRHAMRTDSAAWRGCRSLPLPMSSGGCSARCLRAPAVKRERKSESSHAHRTRCGRANNRYGSFCQGFDARCRALTVLRMYAPHDGPPRATFDISLIKQ